MALSGDAGLSDADSDDSPHRRFSTGDTLRSAFDKVIEIDGHMVCPVHNGAYPPRNASW